MTPTFEPLLPPTAWVTLAGLSLVVWVLYARRRPASCKPTVWWSVMALTAGALLVTLSTLLNPVWLEPLPPPAGKPLLTILIDESDSMARSDVDGGQSRWQEAVTAADTVVDELQSRFDIRAMTFAEQTRLVPPEALSDLSPAGKRTNLAEPILEGLVSDRPQGQAVLLLSDGVDNGSNNRDAVLDAATLARSWDAPIYTATVGSAADVRDVEVYVPRSQELVFVGQSVPITIELRPRGSMGGTTEVVLESRGEALATQTARMSPGKTTPVTFLITPPEVGLFQYRVTADVLPGEATDKNNSANLQVRVVDEPVRALVLEGKPYWDAKFLLRMLTDDPALEVDSLVRLTTDRFLSRRLELVERANGDGQVTDATTDANDASEQPATPAASASRFERREQVEMTSDVGAILEDEEKLGRYQVLLLGREAETYLSTTAVTNLQRWLSEGGGSLICYRGSPVAAPDRELNRLLPVRWETGGKAQTNESRFRIAVTDRGDDLSWLRLGGGDALSKLPSLATTRPPQSIKPLAVVLGRGDQGQTKAPVLSYQPFGMGKVVVIEGAGMWRWAFLAPEYREHEPVYGTLWQSLLRWVLSSGGLMADEQIALQMDRVTFAEGEPISAIVLRREGVDAVPLPAVELATTDTTSIEKTDETAVRESSQLIAVGSEPGVYQVFLGPQPVGRYQLRFDDTLGDDVKGNRVVEFDVRPDLREQLDASARPELMSRISELSGGAVVDVSDPTRFSQLFDEHSEQSRPTQYRRFTAWDRWWVFAGLLLIWIVCWSLRRSSGLI